MPEFTFSFRIPSYLQNEFEGVCGRHTMHFSFVCLCILQWRGSWLKHSSFAFTLFRGNAILGGDKWCTSQCCLRVLCFSKATFISTLGHIYFRDFETGSFHLGDWDCCGVGWGWGGEWGKLIWEVLMQGVNMTCSSDSQGCLLGEGPLARVGRWQGGLPGPGEAGGLGDSAMWPFT